MGSRVLSIYANLTLHIPSGGIYLKLAAKKRLKSNRLALVHFHSQILSELNLDWMSGRAKSEKESDEGTCKMSSRGISHHGR